MSITVYIWKDTPQCTKNRIMARAGADVGDAVKAANVIVEDVKNRGDAALISYVRKCDGSSIDKIKVSDEEFDAAENLLDDDIKDAIKVCAKSVFNFHKIQMDKVEREWMTEVSNGVFAGEKYLQFRRLGFMCQAAPAARLRLSLPCS